MLLHDTIGSREMAKQSIFNGIVPDILYLLRQQTSRLNEDPDWRPRDPHDQEQYEWQRAQTRHTLLEALKFLPLRNQVETVEILRCLSEVASVTSELNEDTIRKIVDLLKDITVQAEVHLKQSDEGMNYDLDPEVLDLVVQTSSSVMTALAEDKTLFSKMEQPQQVYNRISNLIFKRIDDFIAVQLKIHSVGEMPIQVYSSFLSVHASRWGMGYQRPLVLQDIQFQLPNVSTTLLEKWSSSTFQNKQANKSRASNTKIALNSSNQDNKNFLEQQRNDKDLKIDYNYNCFQSRAISFHKDPKSLLKPQSREIQTAISSLNLFSCDGAKGLKVENLSESDSVQIDIQRQNSQFATSHYLAKTNMNIHELIFNGKYGDLFGQSDYPTESQFLHIHINLKDAPVGQLAFPLLVLISHRSVPYNTHNYVYKQVFNQTSKDIKIVLSADKLRARKVYSVGISEASFNSGRRRDVEVKGVHYNFSAWWDKCVYWDENEKMWRNKGCHVLPTSTLQVLHCSCSHLTTFGGVFDIIPHKLKVINVNEFFSPHQNPLIIVVVGTVLLAYIVIVLMIKPTLRYDDDALRRERLVYLQDNSSSHRQRYEVIMETGFHPDAGTTSKISLILHGDESVSETRELTTTESVSLFERNSRNRFLITLPESPGRLVKIQLWHNNCGPSPGWFLRQVIVRDLNSGQTFYFLCQRWLAVDRDDGKIEREFPILDGSAMTFSQVFVCKGGQYLSDLHTWLSIVTCPPFSRFTRTQRPLLCLALLMSYMGLATLWFHQMPPEIRGEFGLLDLSWRNIMVGAFICCLISPVDIIISFIFRRSCMNADTYKLPEGPVGKSGVDLVSQGEDDITPSSVPYSILDQSILNWQHIQEWAHRQWQKRQNHVISSDGAVKDGQPQPSPSMAPLVQLTMLAGEEDTELGSSGFDEAASQATAERNRIIATSDISTIGKKSDSESSVAIISKKKLLLPWWCRYIAWLFCFLLIVAGSVTTVWYGFRFSHRRSVMWIQSVYFSLITCVFIVQPTMIFLKTLFTSFRHCHNPAVFDMECDTDIDLDLELEERKRRELNLWQEEDEMQKALAARSRSRYLRFAGPLQEKQLKSSRHKLRKEHRALSLLRHGFICTFLTMLMVILAFGRYRANQIHLNQAAHQTFVRDQGDKPSFMNIKTLPGWHEWTRKTLVPSLSRIGTLNKRGQTNFSSELGLIIGNVQLRQFRVKPEDCVSLKPLGYGNVKCFHDYSDSAEDKSLNEFGSWPAGGFPGIWGFLAWYGNSGLVLRLSENRDELLKQVDAIESTKWIDHQTRAVSVEMTVYNPPSNLYSSITLLLEVSSSGKVLPSAHIRSSQLFHYVTLWEDCILACELVLLVIIIVIIIKTTQKLFYQRLSYFKHFWNYTEIILCVISILYVLMFIYRFVIVMEIVELLRSTFYEEFVSFAFLTQWDEILHTLLGLMLFCVFVKWVYTISYNPVIARLVRVYRRSKREMLLASIIFIGQIIAFSSFGHLLFGSVYKPMKSFMASAMTAAALSVRILSMVEAVHEVYFLSCFLMFAYIFLYCIVGIYIFSVLAYRLKKLKIKRRFSMPPRKLVKFYYHYFFERPNYRKYLHHQEPDNTLSPEFIMAEILYLVEELLFQMNNLLGTSGLPEKQHSFSDSDSTPNMGDDGISTGGSEDHYKMQLLGEEDEDQSELNRLEDRVHRIEDKLCSNEPYLAQLLKLDSVGTNILSEEEEQELRSQLEFEIFQQLQKQRLKPTDLEDPLYQLNYKSKEEYPKITDSLLNQESKDCTMPVLMYLNSNTKNTSKQMQNTESSPIKLHSPKAQTELKFSELTLDGENKLSSKMHSTNPVMTTKSLKRSQSLKVPVTNTAGLFDMSQGIKKTRQSQCLEKDADTKFHAKLLMNRHSSVKGKKEMLVALGKKDNRPGVTTSILRRPGDTQDKEREMQTLSQKVSSGNVSPQSSEGERGCKRTDSFSGQSGPDTKLETPKMVSKRLDLPPRPTFSHNTILSPPKVRSLDLMGEFTTAESSSGSEQEAGFGSKRMSSLIRRNLRKTKSRGKGKGNDVDIDSAMVLTEDFHSGRHRGMTDFSIIIHPVPSNVELDEISIPEEL